MSGSSGSMINETPAISALRIQSSCYGGSVPVVIGRQRCALNLLYYGDLLAIRHEEEMAGGKGGGGGMTNVTYTYRYDIQWGVCEGPVTVGAIYMQDGSQKQRLDGSDYGYAFYNGALPNSYSAALEAKHPDLFYRYPGLANITAIQMGEFSMDSPPNLSCEVFGYHYDTEIGGADPAKAVQEIAVNKRWGAGAPAVRFPLAGGYGDYAVAMGFVLGLEMAEQRPAADWIEEILEQTDAAAVWAADHLEIIPWGDQAVSGNGRTWSPNVAPVYDLTDDDFIGDEDEPVRVRRKADSETFNIQPVEFRNVENEYNVETVDGDDPASVAMYGAKKNKTTLKAHGLLYPDVAVRVGELKVRRRIRTRNEYEFDLPWTYMRLQPMDIVTLTDGPQHMDRLPVRLLQVIETADMKIQCTAEDFPEGAGRAALLPRQPSSGYNKDFNAAPGNAATPVVFEPPIALAGQPEVWIGTAGGDTWGGANIWISLDNVTYRMIGRTTGKARMGVTTTTLPLVADPDSTTVLGVNLTISSGTLAGATAAERDAFATLSWAGGELIAYQNAVLTGPNSYAISSLRRGAYGSPVAAHAAGVSFIRLDDAVFKYAYDPALLGKTLYVKLQSFNLFGGGIQQLEDLSPVSYTIAGAPLGQVSSLALAQPWTGMDCAVKWAAQKGAAHYTMEVWSGGVRRRTVPRIADTAFVYAWEDNQADGGPYRTLEFRLMAISANGASTSPAILTASNAQMPAPSSLSVTGNGPVLEVMTGKPTLPDYGGTKIWISQTSGFNPLATVPAYDGPDWFLSSVAQAPGVHYVRVAHYDRFGTDSLNVSSEIAVDYIGAIGGIPRVANAATLTALASPSHWAVYDLTTKKIWRWNAATNSYSKAADGADIIAASIAADKLAVAQLSAIAGDMGDLTAGRVHSPSGAVDLDLLNKTFTVDDPMGQERVRAGLLQSGEYGMRVTSADGSKSAVLTPDIGTIVARGTVTMPATLNADMTYGVDVDLGGTFTYADLDIFLNPVNTASGLFIGNLMVDHGITWQSFTYGSTTIYRFNATLDTAGTYKERDTNHPTSGRFRFKTHTVDTNSNNHAIMTTGIAARTDNGNATSGSTIRLIGAKFLTVYDKTSNTIKNVIEIGWPLGLQYTIIARNYQG